MNDDKVAPTAGVKSGIPDVWEWDANDKESPAWVQKLGHPEAPPAPPDLTAITKEAAELKEEIGQLEAKLKAKQTAFKNASSSILKALELMELDSVKAHGYLFFKEEKCSLTTPKTVEDKQALFQFLQEKGLFLEIASVNSQTLNALYRSLAEEAAEQGILEFKLPGVAEPTIYTNLKLRRS